MSMTATFGVMRFHVAALACLLPGVAAWAAGPPGRQEPRPSPPFTGAALPEPPRQKQPWTPPKTTLPKALLSATSALFEAGLADPRGGAYRVIDVGTGSCWSGDAGVVRTHGWVLPSREGEKRHFA